MASPKVRRPPSPSGSPSRFIPSVLVEVAECLERDGLRVFIIGARAVLMHGIDIAREARYWDVALDKPFTIELRDAITRRLRSKGYKV